MYIFLFLHQTATVNSELPSPFRCISSYSYIKPQLFIVSSNKFWVVYLLIPTSNRNAGVYGTQIRTLYIFLFLHQTATRAWASLHWEGCISSYSYIKPQPVAATVGIIAVVYLLIPTSNRNHPMDANKTRIVVYLLIPTSNRNIAARYPFISLLYIFLFLHQTATNTN